MHVGRALPVGRAEPRLFVVPHVRRRRTVPLGAWTRRRAGGRRRRRGPFTCYGRCRPGSTKGSWLHIKLSRGSPRFVVTCLSHCPTARIPPVAFVVRTKTCAITDRIRMPQSTEATEIDHAQKDEILRGSFALSIFRRFEKHCLSAVQTVIIPFGQREFIIHAMCRRDTLRLLCRFWSLSRFAVLKIHRSKKDPFVYYIREIFVSRGKTTPTTS